MSVVYQIDLISLTVLSDDERTVLDKNVTASSLELFERLKTKLEQQKLYAQKGLNVSKLCELLQSNEKHISRAVQQHSGMSVNRFINLYRTMHALKILMSKPKTEHKLRLEEIAHQSGFNSKATFYRVFTEIVGVAPGEVLENMNIEKIHFNLHMKTLSIKSVLSDKPSLM